MAAWDATSVIITKRDGQPLPAAAIEWFIHAYTHGEVADEQAAALCMAVYLNGLNRGELEAWTNAMIDSGDRVSFGEVGRPLVDKHSTGGVGDKISLILCPLVAACGAAMPQVAGRGLGHTGGTIDKMAAIPGWKPDLSRQRAETAMVEIGAMITSASANLAPADGKLYALRDVTGTVASIPLIASSIMSKKIASGTSSLVLDIKVGRGAFMTERDQARRLGETMVEIGNDAGVKTVALLTRMDHPLGRAVGNTLEVDESIEALQGKGPQDVRAVTIALATEMLTLAGIDQDAAALLDQGEAFDVFERMVRFQGGDLDAPRARAQHQTVVTSVKAGIVQDLDALAIGLAAMRLGAGRARKEDKISYGAGIECLRVPGEEVSEGEPVLRLHTDDERHFDDARQQLAQAVTVGPEPPEIPDVVIERIS